MFLIEKGENNSGIISQTIDCISKDRGNTMESEPFAQF